MSSPYVGEIRMFAGNFAPVGWAFCDGSILPISENDVLFNLIGTTYGGDGQTTFALPDLRGRLPIHAGTGGGGTYVIGERAGLETVTLTSAQIPSHAHLPEANSHAGASGDPASHVWAASNDYGQYAAASSVNGTMAPGAIGSAGGSQPHDNMPPFLVINFIISLFGVFPSPT